MANLPVSSIYVWQMCHYHRTASSGKSAEQNAGKNAEQRAWGINTITCIVFAV
jgi:hypothetical protein